MVGMSSSGAVANRGTQEGGRMVQVGVATVIPYDFVVAEGGVN